MRRRQLIRKNWNWTDEREWYFLTGGRQSTVDSWISKPFFFVYSNNFNWFVVRPYSHQSKSMYCSWTTAKKHTQERSNIIGIVIVIFFASLSHMYVFFVHHRHHHHKSYDFIYFFSYFCLCVFWFLHFFFSRRFTLLVQCFGCSCLLILFFLLYSPCLIISSHTHISYTYSSLLEFYMYEYESRVRIFLLILFLNLLFFMKFKYFCNKKHILIIMGQVWVTVARREFPMTWFCYLRYHNWTLELFYFCCWLSMKLEYVMSWNRKYLLWFYLTEI